MAKEEREMSFLGHIVELRGHLIRSILAIVVGAIIVGIFWDFLLQKIIMAPLKSDFPTFQIFNSVAKWIGMDQPYTEKFDMSKDLMNLDPSGQITSQISVVLICGLIIAIPYVVWEIWKFIKPGLSVNEQKSANGTVLATTFFFLLGVTFSYYLLLPLSTQFLFTYNPFGVNNEWKLMSYISLFVQTLLGMGVVFLLPIFAYFLAKVGILTPKFLKTYRRHAFVVILTIAAIITPNDFLSMMIAAFPLWVLYEFSILVTSYVVKKQLKESKKDLVKN
ncbi:twin-arginine translocase subunit TatC [Moheibacter sediminis]|uniref:Sec-independent protein translocase protein TatC n=1 Tax=Moheibacter sediminis TaxID=1434700 RepID=A0A1W1ZMH8_9FLAO|nr:twin-arginine translocase subunit TatC [Moheibacter sediminis]SMC49422.1 sec-independent protein translocase protein TatC [Moheibacter sediminis]